MASHRCMVVFYGRISLVFLFLPDSHWSSRQIHICTSEGEEEYTFNLKLINFCHITTYHNSLGLSVSLKLLTQASQNCPPIPHARPRPPNNCLQRGLCSIVGLLSDRDAADWGPAEIDSLFQLEMKENKDNLYNSFFIRNPLMGSNQGALELNYRVSGDINFDWNLLSGQESTWSEWHTCCVLTCCLFFSYDWLFLRFHGIYWLFENSNVKKTPNNNNKTTKHPNQNPKHQNQTNMRNSFQSSYFLRLKYWGDLCV